MVSFIAIIVMMMIMVIITIDFMLTLIFNCLKILKKANFVDLSAINLLKQKDFKTNFVVIKFFNNMQFCFFLFPINSQNSIFFFFFPIFHNVDFLDKLFFMKTHLMCLTTLNYRCTKRILSLTFQ